MDFELAEMFALIDAQELERAAPLCFALQKRYPKDVSVAQACAQTFAGIGDWGNALKMFKRIAALEPNSFEASYNLAVALNAAQRDEEALRYYLKAMRLDPLNVNTQNNYASTLSRLGRTTEALALFNRLVTEHPTNVSCLYNLGIMLLDNNRVDEASSLLETAVSLDPEHSGAWLAYGNALSQIGESEKAIAAYEAASRLSKGSPHPHINFGIALQLANRLPEAASAFEHAAAIDPERNFSLGYLLNSKMRMCLWHAFDEQIMRLKGFLLRDLPVASPHTVLALIDDPLLQQKAAQIWAKTHFPNVKNKFRRPAKVKKNEKIKIGYFSADFKNHPVTSLIAGIIEAHDRSQFETYCFSYGSPKEDEGRRRIAAGCDAFFDIRLDSDSAVVHQSRDIGIDIAIDLTGHTLGARSGLFLERVAPVQCNFLGYPGTMSMSCFDYIITDRTVVPDNQQQFFEEKLFQMPGCYLPNDRSRPISKAKFTRSDLYLPENDFVFCCFNNNYKITPSVFGVWMSILRSVEKSVLWLSHDNDCVVQNLCREAASFGVDPERLVFAPRMPMMADHLARYALADLFLDTLPYNAHTTASDALWCGLPVLTRVGESFPGRVAASLLSNLDLPELIVGSDEDYIKVACNLAVNRDQAAALKEKVALNVERLSVFDASVYARHLEAAYKEMISRSN